MVMKTFSCAEVKEVFLHTGIISIILLLSKSINFFFLDNTSVSLKSFFNSAE